MTTKKVPKECWACGRCIGDVSSLLSQVFTRQFVVFLGCLHTEGKKRGKKHDDDVNEIAGEVMALISNKKTTNAVRVLALAEQLSFLLSDDKNLSNTLQTIHGVIKNDTDMMVV